MPAKPLDILGIGIGPFNLGLACLVRPIKSVDCLFVERNEEFAWHGGTLIETATLQTPFLCDLVTLADPTSPFSLLNYFKETGRIYTFYAVLIDTANFFLPRNEFNAYFRWAAAKLDTLQFNRSVDMVTHDSATGLYRVTARNRKTDQPVNYLTRRLVLASGMTPAVPEVCVAHKDRIVHSSDYLANRDKLRTKRSITIVGSGQSAAEIYHDLLSDIDRHGYRLTWITRSPRLIPRELTKQTLQMTTPDYTDYFFSLPRAKREALITELKGVYQGINPSLINDIMDLRYRKLLTGRIEADLIANTEIAGCRYDAARDRFYLNFFQREEEQHFEHETDALVLGTGYRWQRPAYLDGIADRINWTENGRFAVDRNCAIDKAGSEIFVSNSEIHADSFIPPDLGQACHRNSIILAKILGHEPYSIERKVAFQRFSAPSAADVAPVPVRA